MRMTLSRREAIKVLSGGAAAGLVVGGGPGGLGLPRAAAQGGRALGINLLGYSLGIHIPGIAGALDLLPGLPGYAPPKTARLDQIRTLTQTLIAGAVDIGETDPITVFRAVESGADLKVIGNVYVNTSLVLVANADRVQDLKDLEKPDVLVSIATKGDVTYAMLFGPMLKRGIDPKKVTFVEIAGSGGRMRALLSKRVHVGPMHFDQAAQLAKQGNFKVILEPWKEYRAWMNEIWAGNGAWLRKPENQRAAVDLMKAVLMGFRKGTADFGWYLEKYRKHATLPKAAEATPDEIRPLWHTLAQELKAWPASNDFTIEHFRELLPVYKAAGAIEGTIKLDQVIDTSYVEQAVKELGA